MKFLSNQRWVEVEIDLSSASEDEIREAYSSINEWAGCGKGKFPGSKEWERARAYEAQLEEIKAARPEFF